MGSNSAAIHVRDCPQRNVVAAKREGVPCLPYARELIRLGLRTAGERLDRIDPLLCQQLVADRLADADWESRFLTGSWQTLVSQMTDIGLLAPDSVHAEDAYSLKFLSP